MGHPTRKHLSTYLKVGVLRGSTLNPYSIGFYPTYKAVGDGIIFGGQPLLVKMPQCWFGTLLLGVFGCVLAFNMKTANSILYFLLGTCAVGGLSECRYLAKASRFSTILRVFVIKYMLFTGENAALFNYSVENSVLLRKFECACFENMFKLDFQRDRYLSKNNQTL
jgi:hypothetical protein